MIIEYIKREVTFSLVARGLQASPRPLLGLYPLTHQRFLDPPLILRGVLDQALLLRETTL